MTQLSPFTELAAEIAALTGLHSEAEILPAPLPVTVSEATFSSRARALFALQYAEVPLYRRWCDQTGIRPGTVRHWQGVPALPISAFKEFEVSSIPSAGRTVTFESSRTTSETGSRHFHHAESLRLYEASLLPAFAAHVLSGPARAMAGLALMPSWAEAPFSSLAYMLATLRRRLPWTSFTFAGVAGSERSWRLEAARAEAAFARSRTTGEPLVVLGPAFSMVHLLEHFESTGFDARLAPGSRVMETGGYKGRSREIAKAELYAWIERQWQVPSRQIVGEYGMTELSSQAYDRVVDGAGTSTDERVFQFPPWVRVRCVSPETMAPVAEGEVGLIAVCDLANVWSVMHILTEDLGRCMGSGFCWVGRAPDAGMRGCSRMWGEP